MCVALAQRTCWRIQRARVVGVSVDVRTSEAKTMPQPRWRRLVVRWRSSLMIYRYPVSLSSRRLASPVKQLTMRFPNIVCRYQGTNIGGSAARRKSVLGPLWPRAATW